jgi:peptidoglycan/LPS O-acetylase OafA/YrhL
LASSPFFPDGHAAWLVLGAGAVLGLGLVYVAGRYCSPRRVTGFVGSPLELKVVEWERDRVMAAAKGLASTAAGFFVTVVTALLTKDIPSDVNILALIGCLAGAIGTLVLAGHLSRLSSQFIRNPAGVGLPEDAP